MIKGITHVRVRYGEVDSMGYAYYGNYGLYFELGRVELLRSIGLSYKGLEDSGVMLPVRSLNCNYHAPAKYDDNLCIETTVKEIPRGARINFEYKITNQDGKLLTTGNTELVFVDMQKNKPMKSPKILIEKMEQNSLNKNHSK